MGSSDAQATLAKDESVEMRTQYENVITQAVNLGIVPPADIGAILLDIFLTDPDKGVEVTTEVLAKKILLAHLQQKRNTFYRVDHDIYNFAVPFLGSEDEFLKLFNELDEKWVAFIGHHRSGVGPRYLFIITEHDYNSRYTDGVDPPGPGEPKIDPPEIVWQSTPKVVDDVDTEELPLDEASPQGSEDNIKPSDVPRDCYD